MKAKVSFSSQLQLCATVTAGLILSPSVEVLGTGELQGKENWQQGSRESTDSSS